MTSFLFNHLFTLGEGAGDEFIEFLIEIQFMYNIM